MGEFRKLSLGDEFFGTVGEYKEVLLPQILKHSKKIYVFIGACSAQNLACVADYFLKQQLGAEVHIYTSIMKGINGKLHKKEDIVEYVTKELDCDNTSILRDLNLWICSNRVNINLVMCNTESGLCGYMGHGLVAVDEEDLVGLDFKFEDLQEDSSIYVSISLFKSWNSIGIYERNFFNSFRQLVDKSDQRFVQMDIKPHLCVNSGLQGRDEADFITIPVELFDYQKDAITAWQNKNFRGIFDMATGSGKTITAISAVNHLYKTKEYKLAVVVLCPYQHLVEQWVSELVRFQIVPIVGYSGTKYAGYEKRLKTKIINYNRRQKDFLCFVTTNSTFATDRVQELLNTISDNVMLIADEAHYLGTENMRRLLTDSYDYRLALSATLDRQWDETGTRFLRQYFGGVAYQYSIERAINEHKLTPYKYYPIFTTLLPDEYEKYIELSSEIKKYILYDEDGIGRLTDKAKFLLIARARIIAGSVSKVNALFDYIDAYKRDNHMLIYCGATGYENQETDYDAYEQRQIEYVCEQLLDQKGILSKKFTADEGADERKQLLKEFDDGERLQALVAIKCLDEGVDIPNMKTAFILASSVNPKEFIQRRGRLLRRAPGKEYAEIYDFVSLPIEVEVAQKDNILVGPYDRALVKREFRRIIEYNRLAMNAEENMARLAEVAEAFDIADIGGDDDEWK